MKFLVVLTIIFGWLELIWCSLGDTDPNYRRCVRFCSQNGKFKQNISQYMLLLGWDETSECQYDCMHSIAKTLLAESNQILKYYGHWPYQRVFGFQEPASAIFSFMNAWPHLHFLLYEKNKLNNFYMKNWITLYGLMALIAWLCSTIFHIRKVYWTIQLDYMSALLFISCGCGLSFRYLFHAQIHQWPFLQWLGGAVASCLLCHQIHGMARDTVAFSDHMALSIGLCVLHVLTWMVWILLNRSTPNAPLCLLLQAWLGAASLLEIFDFPPVLTHFDAHALWHLATVPLGYLWYHFWKQEWVRIKALSEKEEARGDDVMR